MRMVERLPVVDGEIARVLLTQSQTAVIDATDAELVSSNIWFAYWNPCTRSYYAGTKTRGIKGRQTTLPMHRLILDAQPGHLVDHRNHDTLNNRRSNLRLATHVQNNRNMRGPRRDNTRGYLGVKWNKQCRRWGSAVRVEGRSHYLGLFDTAIDAARARDEWIREQFPDDEFWTFNFARPGDPKIESRNG